MKTLILLGLLFAAIGYIIYLKNNNISLSDDNKTLIKVWVEHLYYTRLVVVSVLSGVICKNSLRDQDVSPEFELLKQRLLQNQKDIGNVFRKKFGDKVGDDITTELTTHISIAATILMKIKNGDDYSTDIQAFYKNA